MHIKYVIEITAITEKKVINAKHREKIEIKIRVVRQGTVQYRKLYDNVV